MNMFPSVANRIRRLLVVAVFCLSAAWSFAADNVVIKTPILESHFYRPIKQPLYVVYALFKGGGDCPRTGMSFKNDQSTLGTATANDYSHSGFDQGHLANAEDFANDCAKERLTFVFYNAVPQTVNLNRGIWETVEARVRAWSQDDHLIVICGGYAFRKKGRLYVPTHCFKIVQSESTGKILFCGTFTNSSKAKEKDITEPALEKILGYKLPIRRSGANNRTHGRHH